MITAILVDDESVALARLRRFLSDESDIEIVAECRDGRSAVDAITRLQPALVFLDIQMPELNGFEVLSALDPEHMPEFVFVTAYAEHALDAFEVGAIDYLTKPFDAERLQKTLDRYRRRRARSADDRTRLFAAIRELVAAGDREPQPGNALPLLPAGTEYLERFLIKGNERMYFVRVADVEFIESASNYVKLHVGSHVHMLRETLTDVATQLNPRQFARVHRTTIVNIDFIKEIQPWFSGDAILVMRGGQNLRLSRSHRSALELSTFSRR